jgi:hypothetical protein
MSKHVKRLPEHSYAVPGKSQREDLAASDRALQPLESSAILQRAALAPGSLRPADIQRLQRTIGNRAVGQLLSQLVAPPRTFVQAKLTVNAPGDEYEQEADRIAEEVTQMPAVQRAAVEDEDEDETPEIMTKPQQVPAPGGAFEPGEAFEQQLQAARGQGQPLPPTLKEDFEAKFGADFSGVRLHTDAQADELTCSLQARAFTTGQDIFLRQGEDNLTSLSGRQTLAHELTHVLQQGGGRPDQTPRPAANAGSDFSVQRLVSKEDFEKLAGKPSAKSKVDLAGGTYPDILKKLEAYEKENKNKTLVELKVLCTKWINSHTRMENTGGERQAKKTKDLRKADYIKGLLEEVKAELGEDYNQAVSTPTKLTEQQAKKLKEATTAVTAAESAESNARPASRYELTLLASVQNPDLLPFAEKRLELTIENKTKGWFSREQKSGKDIKREAATSVVEARAQVLTDEEKKKAIDKIVDESGRVGHTWVKLKKYDATDKQLAEHSFGFYPLHDYNRPELTVPGEVVYGDKGTTQHVDQLAKNFELTAEEYGQALGKALEIMEERPDYKLIDYNCTAFAKAVVEAAGQEFPGGFMRVPGNAVSAVTGIGWGKAYNPNALYGKLSERMEQYKSEGVEQSEQLESERWRRSVYIPEPPGAKPQVGFSPQSLEGRLWGFVDKNMNREPQFLFNSLHVQQGARDTDIPAFTEFRLIDVSSGKAVLDVKGTQYHITNLAELAYAMGLQ